MNKQVTYINISYPKKVVYDMYIFLEYKFGKDISNKILKLIIREKNYKCSICNNYKNENYSYCLYDKCNDIICNECYQITSKFNKFKPFCKCHFNKYNSKKKLIFIMKKKINKHNIQYLHYIYKYHNKTNYYFTTYYKNKKNYIKLPPKKYICSNYYFRMYYNILYIFIADNIHEAISLIDTVNILH